MKLQFSTSTVLLATAFLGVWMGCLIPYVRRVAESSGAPPSIVATIWYLMGAALILTPPLTPLLFAVYALGRRALTAKTVIAVAITEFGILAAFWYLSA